MRILAVLLIFILTAFAVADWDYGIGFDGLKPTSFELEYSQVNSKVKVNPHLDLTFGSDNATIIGVDFLHPIPTFFTDLYFGAGFSYSKLGNDTAFTSIPVMLACYKDLNNKFMIKFGAKATGLDLTHNNIEFTTTKLFWTIYLKE